ncbi:MAG: hypothetical protein JWN89_596 [Parcubacteria group bacterium]|nr:hypothetical protein [Parcubacteria group bacterium]
MDDERKDELFAEGDLDEGHLSADKLGEEELAPVARKKVSDDGDDDDDVVDVDDEEEGLDIDEELAEYE